MDLWSLKGFDHKTQDKMVTSKEINVYVQINNPRSECLSISMKFLSQHGENIKLTGP